MTYPVFATGDVLNASDMNAVGLWLIKSQTVGTAVASVTLTSVFSSSYDNYLIQYNGGVGSTAQSIALQFGPSSVSGYNTGYYQILSYGAYATGALTTTNVNNGTSWSYVGESSANWNSVNIVVQNPNLAKYSTLHGGYAGTVGGWVTGYHGSTGQFTEFTLTVAGTLTGGTIRVYGYRN